MPNVINPPAARFVTFDPPVAITDLPNFNSTAKGTVDLTKNGVPAGAARAWIVLNGTAASAREVRARPFGSASDSSANHFGTFTTIQKSASGWVDLDANGKCELWAAGTPGAWSLTEGWVMGYAEAQGGGAGISISLGGDVTAGSTMTDGEPVGGDGGAKGIRTLSDTELRTFLNVADGADVGDLLADGSVAMTGQLQAAEGVHVPDNKIIALGDETWGLIVDDALRHLNFYYGSAEDAAMFLDIDTGVVALNSVFATNFASKNGAGAPTFPNYLKTDQIDEENAGSGVTVDGVLIKDGLVDGRDVSADGATLDAIGDPLVMTSVEYTISTGSIDVTNGHHFIRIDTEADAAADDLDTITVGGTTPPDGYVLFLRAENDARTVDVTSAGNINPSGAGTSDATSTSLSDNDRSVLAVYDAALAQWVYYGVQF